MQGQCEHPLCHSSCATARRDHDRDAPCGGCLEIDVVDTDTGAVKILDYAVAEDCGRIVNPMIVDGQIHGGVAQGIGGGLLEEMVYDETGQLLTGFLSFTGTRSV